MKLMQKQQCLKKKKKKKKLARASVQIKSKTNKKQKKLTESIFLKADFDQNFENIDHLGSGYLIFEPDEYIQCHDILVQYLN